MIIGRVLIRKINRDGDPAGRKGIRIRDRQYHGTVVDLRGDKD